MGRGLVDIMGRYTQTFLWLQQYDEGLLKDPKGHPFIDGNKRSGAFLFVDFLHRNGRLLKAGGHPIINDTGLAALTLLVAESAPNQKDTIIKLIMNLLCEAEAKNI